MRNSFYSIEK